MLNAFGAVAIDGPKWCGKTWTALNHGNSVTYIGDPTGNFQNRQAAQLDPSLVLDGEAPKVIDEWQEVPALWDAVRFSVDQSAERGRYILTGSSTPNFKGVLHSGAGRIGVTRMRPMSLFESGYSTGVVSLSAMFELRLESRFTGEVTVDALIKHVIMGGWPGTRDMSPRDAREVTEGYLYAVTHNDISRIDSVSRNPHRVMMLLRSLARNESTIASLRRLKKDMQEYDDDILDEKTITDYLEVLQRLFLIDDQPAFNPNMRSSVRVGKMPKRHLADPSLAAAALGATQETLKGDLNTFGFLFEAMCERDLRIYAQCADGELYHYRDGRGREIDAVITLPDGRWAAMEIKLGAHQIDEAASKLLALQADMKRDPKAIPPSLLCVVCGMTAYAYTRPDGVCVVPITALRE
ncbi:DUF4143 domain-containing protein [Bifidobacterium aquikefiricola]|uniref:DUF4143 domain-containing protein n=2 Tax=Bifidobacterium TaxID=1678 RepID=A0AB39U9L0_9BIFI